MPLSRPNVFALTLLVGFLLPVAIPGTGLDYPYFFILVIVLFAWFLIKWDSVKKIESKSSATEVVLGLVAIGAIYGYNVVQGSQVGLLDLLVIFMGAVVSVYGIRTLKQFWVPMAYGVVLLAGYQIENYTPNFVGLQNWLAAVLASSVSLLGIGASASGHLVSMSVPNGPPLLLDVAGDCTGIQGILAFGMLSTMTLLDLKPRMSRLIPIFAAGFLGAFLINIVRLIVVFLTFEYLGVDAGNTMHVYFGYLIFIVWVLAFWAIAFRYLGAPRGALPQQIGAAPAVPSVAGG